MPIDTSLFTTSGSIAKSDIRAKLVLPAAQDIAALQADVTALESEVDSSITNLQTDIDALESDVAALETAVAGKAATSHTHVATAISDSTSAGRALLTGADAAAQRTSLGLGTIATVASPVPVANGGTGATSAGAALTNLGVSAYAATILDDANAGAAQTTLGISAFAQTVLDDANAATARSTLGAGVPTTGSLGTTGYVVDGDTGLITQWGAVNGGSTVTFPVAFPTAVFRVQLTGAHATLPRIPTIGTLTTTQVVVLNWDTGGSASTNSVHWLAFGN